GPNNRPTDVIGDRGAVTVIGVAVGSNPIAWAGATAGTSERKPAAVDSERPNILDLLIRVSMISSNGRATVLRQQCDLLLMPQIYGLGLMNFRGYQLAIDAGYSTTMEKIGDIRQGVNRLGSR